MPEEVCYNRAMGLLTGHKALTAVFALAGLVVSLLLTVTSCAVTVGDKPQQAEDVFLPEGGGFRVEPWIEGLEIPWSLVFLPDGRALVSERPGIVRLISAGRLMKQPYAVLEVAHTGEGGLMGIAVHPAFPGEPYIYAMHTYREGGSLYNRVVRLKHLGERGELDKVVIDRIPGGRFHNGGRIAFGPDGMLYVTTGEIFSADLAQDLRSLGGKILRIKPDGGVPDDNPIPGSAVYSYGHRNPQGLAWQPGAGRLYASEHGPSGEFGRFAHDEINLIVKGGNYGWPKVIGAAGKEGFLDPVVVWKETTPPSGMTFVTGDLLKGLKGSLFVATLRSEALVRIVLGEGGRAVRIERWFSDRQGSGKYGRIRDVVEGPDGALYFLTNNRDGRGKPLAGDDRIYRILP